RRAFAAGSRAELPRLLKLGLYADDGAIVWINGIEVLRFNARDGEQAFNATAARPAEARWQEFLLPNPALYLREGENVVAVHAMNSPLTSNDFSIDLEVFSPGAEDGETLAFPTPGAENTVFSANAPPQIRQVDHFPVQPASGEPITITARITDAEGVAAATLLYQAVAPGSYVPAFLPLPQNILLASPTQPLPPNAAFEEPSNWAAVAMADDGERGDRVARDGLYTAMVPAQASRTLLRYRIRAADARAASVTVPYLDDRSLNFACFVYDGVPPYVASTRSVHADGPGHVYGSELLTSLPVYFLITRGADLDQCTAYSGANQIPKSNEGARDKFNWEGAFVYDGVVYDHVKYRLRQANDRYGGAGKRAMRIRFQKGNYLQAHDNYGRAYPTRWRTLNTGKMFDNKRVGNFGLTESINAVLWNLVGVPAPAFNTFHLRVIRGPEEAPAGPTGQYLGDFYGMFNGIEDYDPRFLEAHHMADGNLYKLKDGIFNGNLLKRNQGRYAVTTDEDFQNIRRSLRPERNDDWLNLHVNYER
ncbi:MAG TPA: choice-of-anchor X domain-containing protein, partial [Gemmatimonadales bacterium]|nr:choice-of-anchor X domain-containing protein [Gemmatimonadales bacterium]